MATAVLLAAPDEKADIANLSFPAVLGASLERARKKASKAASEGSHPARCCCLFEAAAKPRVRFKASFPSNSFAGGAIR